ncbi:CLUMA_CG007554, isoform A [Clunio marinus]|uniref:CLUMA_CG007554, isoform A n=1 Tax=Clunio marinus TaxID=568069 RepID=A0A1J1I542_9DIPT|nr:CLUMA_CG007554, isoform A [Clunio marinus]
MKTQKIQEFINNVELDAFESSEVSHYFGSLPSQKQGNEFKLALLTKLLSSFRNTFKDISNLVNNELNEELSPEDLQTVFESMANQVRLEFPLSCIQEPLSNLSQLISAKDSEFIELYSVAIESLRN